MKPDLLRFQAIFETSSMLLVLADLEGRIIDVNRAARRIREKSRTDMLHRPFWECFWSRLPPGPDRQFQEAIQRAASGTEVLDVVEMLGRVKGPQVLEFSLRPLGEPDEAAAFLMFEGRDLTPLREAEQELREREREHSAVLSTMAAGTVMMDTEGMIQSCNASAEQILGLTRDQMTGRSSYDPRWRTIYEDGSPFPPEAHPAVVTLRTGQPCSNVVMGMHKPDGTLTWISINTDPLRRLDTNEIYGVVATFHDITQQRNTEEALIRSRNRLRQLAARIQDVRENERTRLSREVHDVLGQSLTGLRMDLAWIERDLSSNPSSVCQRVEAMKQTISETIDVARRIAADLRPGILDDLGILAALEWQTEKFAKRSGLKTSFTNEIGDFDLDPRCSTALFRIFQEILTNVARHADASSVRVRLYRTESDLALEVQDDGRGIHESDLRNPSSLGLLGMRERLYPWQGRVEFEGEPDDGTTVTVSLPFK